MIFSVPVYVVALRYFSDTSTLLSSYLFFLMLLTMAGALWPDIDLLFGIKHHRHPITHSLLLPLIMLVAVTYADLPRLLDPVLLTTVTACYQAFLVGVASHLLGDAATARTLKWLPSKWEMPWFIVNGAATFAVLYATGFFSLEAFTGWL